MGNIVVIGPRSSGKTTYLAALAYLPDLTVRKEKEAGFIVNPLNEESRKLAEQAENILCQGATLEPTRLNEVIKGVDDLPYYSFQIEVRKTWWRKQQQIQLNVRDYPGEVFEKIADRNLSDDIHRQFIDECLLKDIRGCLLLLTHWENERDKFYKRVMDQFIRTMDEKDRIKDLKLAVVMGKCERGELWPGRIDPETDLFNQHLPRTTNILKEKLPANNLRFFAFSTFGVLAKNDPRPNRIDSQGKDGQESVLRDHKKWNPYNMIQPIYWLSQDK